MGLVSKHFNQKKTNQLVQPIQAETGLDPETVYNQARKVVNSWEPGKGLGGIWNEQHYRYWLRQKSDGSTWIVCGQPPIIKGTIRTDWDSDRIQEAHWEARLEVSAGKGESGQHTMQLKLVRWKTRDGKMHLRKSFEIFRDQFFSVLTQADSSFRLTSAA